MQNLPFCWDNRKLKFCEKIHAKYGGGYCCKEKIKFKIMSGERNDLAAAAPNGNNVSVPAPLGADLWAVPSWNAAGLK